jgi:hypothetical protein
VLLYQPSTCNTRSRIIWPFDAALQICKYLKATTSLGSPNIPVLLQIEHQPPPKIFRRAVLSSRNCKHILSIHAPLRTQLMCLIAGRQYSSSIITRHTFGTTHPATTRFQSAKILYLSDRITVCLANIQGNRVLRFKQTTEADENSVSLSPARKRFSLQSSQLYPYQPPTLCH